MSGLTYSFAQELWLAIHDFDTDVMKMSLYSTQNLSQELTAYTATGEVSGGGYSAGGEVVTMTIDFQTNTVTITPDETVFSIPSTVNSLMIYNSSKANRSVMVAPVVGATASGTLTVRFQQPAIALTV